MSGIDSIAPFFGPFLLLIGLTVLVFVLLRKLALWYWRINDVVKYLATIESHLRRAPWNQQGAELQEWERQVGGEESGSTAGEVLLARSDLQSQDEYRAWTSKTIRTHADLEAFRSGQKKLP